MKIVKPIAEPEQNYDYIKRACDIIENTYENFGLIVRIVAVHTKVDEIAIELQLAIGTEVKQVFDHNLDIALALGVKENAASFELCPNNQPHILLTVKRPMYFELDPKEIATLKDVIHLKDPIYKVCKAIDLAVDYKGHQSIEVTFSNLDYLVRLTGNDDETLLAELVNNVYAQPHNLLSKNQVHYLKKLGWNQDTKSETLFFRTTSIHNLQSSQSLACSIVHTWIDIWDFDISSFINIEIAKPNSQVPSTTRMQLAFRSLLFLTGRYLMRKSGSPAAD